MLIILLLALKTTAKGTFNFGLQAGDTFLSHKDSFQELTVLTPFEFFGFTETTVFVS